MRSRRSSINVCGINPAMGAIGYRKFETTV
jgi:hypothetical protein